MSNCWRYKKKSICSIKDIPKEFQDKTEIQIIYKITLKVQPGVWYIGKKIMFNTKKSRISKKKKLELKTRKVFEYKKTESNWVNYYGSSTNVEWLHLIETLGHDKFDREILMFVEGKSKAAFYEAKYLFSDEGMMNPKCMNLNILSKFFKNKLNE
jgi:hypothetical protein